MIAGHHSSVVENPAIPAVVFTDPELAWTGLTEREAGQQGLTVDVGAFHCSRRGELEPWGEPRVW